MRPSQLLSLLLHLLLVVALSHPTQAKTTESSSPRKIVGGWAPIKNLSDPHVVEIARFAVSEDNKQSGANLVFSKVIKGETQVVSGINYKLSIEAKDGEKVGNYEAVVWVKEWENFKKLVSFKSISN